MKRSLSVPSHYQYCLQIIDIHPRAISQNISKMWWQFLCTCQWSLSSLASPVLLGSQWVNPCLRSPMHEWAARSAEPVYWPSQLTKYCQPSDCTEEHYVSFPGMEHMSVELRKNIWLFIYMAWHWTLPNRLINITLHIHIRVNIWLAISCIMTCIMIVSYTNRPDNFSQSPCAVPSCRLVGWLNRFIYRANIARAPKLATLTG